MAPSDLPNKPVCVLLALILSVLCANGVNGMWIIPSNNTAPPVYIQSPRVRFMSPEVTYPITGELVISNDRLPTGNLTGKILLHRLQSFMFIEDVTEHMKDSGLKAHIIIFNSATMYPGLSQYGRMRRHLPNQPFPIFEITSLQNWTQLAKWFYLEPTGVVARIEKDDPNPWDKVYQKWLPPLCWVIVIASAMVCTLAVYKLTLHIFRDGVRLSVPQLVLWFNIISSLIRFFHLLVDPMGAYGIYPYWWVQFASTLPWPFTVTSALLITLYWHEMIKQYYKMNQFLDKGFVPFLVIGAVLWTFEFFSSLMRGLGAVVFIVTIIYGIVYAVVILGLLIFFVVTKIRLDSVFRKLNRNINSTVTNQPQKRLQLASNIVIAIGVVFAIFLSSLLALGVGMAIGTTFFAPIGFFTIFTLLSVSNTTLTALQVLLIRTPKQSCGKGCCDVIDSDTSKSKRDDTKTSKEELATTSRI